MSNVLQFRRAPDRFTGQCPLVDHMRVLGRPVSRESYIAFNYPDGVPSPWTQELENELPEEIRLMSDPSFVPCVPIALASSPAKPARTSLKMVESLGALPV